MAKFQHVIAFGCACNVAAGLSRLGLREHSGPFDWIMSNMQLNLTLIKNGFRDFMLKENLIHRHHPMNNGQFFDQYYHIGFIHDFDPSQNAPSLDEQYPIVRARYQRRIDYLMESLKEPTLLVHSFWGHEVTYLEEHIDEIMATIKSFHPDNDIIFMTNECDPADHPKLKLYKVNVYDDDHVLGRSFDDDPELKAFLMSDETYPVEKRAKNLSFFIKKQIESMNDISHNETRIAKETLEYEAKYWMQWARLGACGKKITDRLIADGIQKVGLVGMNDLAEVMIEQLKAAGITPMFTCGWYWETTMEEFCGIPVHAPRHVEPSEEEKKKFEEERKKLEEENERRMAEGLPPLRHHHHHHRSFLCEIAGVDDVDAMIACDVETAYFLNRDRIEGRLPCKLYDLSDLTGGERVYLTKAATED